MRDEFTERLSELGQRRRSEPQGPRAAEGRRSGPLARLEELPGTVRTDGVLVVERTVSELMSAAGQRELLKAFGAGAAASARGDLDEQLRMLLDAPERAIFMDTETTGLSGNMVFMLGAMRVADGGIRLTQVFARDYREEPELLRVWVEMLAGSGLLVTFNGKSFDMPVLRDRLNLHGVSGPSEPPHLDLLHHARRRWRRVLPDCRLQTLEWKICGRRRAGDIPGEEIPAAYHHFVRTGQSADMLSVFHHNALDLITLADIALALAGRGVDGRWT